MLPGVPGSRRPGHASAAPAPPPRIRHRASRYPKSTPIRAVAGGLWRERASTKPA
jgi:hypothetical protein